MPLAPWGVFLDIVFLTNVSNNFVKFLSVTINSFTLDIFNKKQTKYKKIKLDLKQLDLPKLF